MGTTKRRHAINKLQRIESEQRQVAGLRKRLDGIDAHLEQLKTQACSQSYFVSVQRRRRNIRALLIQHESKLADLSAILPDDIAARYRWCSGHDAYLPIEMFHNGQTQCKACREMNR